MLLAVGQVQAGKAMLAVVFLLQHLAVEVVMVLLDQPGHLHPKLPVEQA
jgi:hypothetical protein